MFHYVGRFSGLSQAQQSAVTDLTVRRYIDEIYDIGTYLEHSKGLRRGSLEFHEASRAYHGEIREALARYDESTYLSALLFRHRTGEWTAVAAMRMIHGRGQGAPLSQTIGRADSSLPTHRLLESFCYPQLPNFNPDAVTESQLFEASRLVCPDKTVHTRLTDSGEMSETEYRAMQSGAFDVLMVSAKRFVGAMFPTASWIFNVKPRLAAALRIRQGLDLIPLYLNGVQPTAQALSSTVDQLYFHRWNQELLNMAPTQVADKGIAAVVRHLSGCSLRVWQDCAASLPYLVVSGASFDAAINKIGNRVSLRPHNLHQELNHD